MNRPACIELLGKLCISRLKWNICDCVLSESSTKGKPLPKFSFIHTHTNECINERSYTNPPSECVCLWMKIEKLKCSEIWLRAPSTRDESGKKRKQTTCNTLLMNSKCLITHCHSTRTQIYIHKHTYVSLCMHAISIWLCARLSLALEICILCGALYLCAPLNLSICLKRAKFFKRTEKYPTSDGKTSRFSLCPGGWWCGFVFQASPLISAPIRFLFSMKMIFQ